MPLKRKTKEMPQQDAYTQGIGRRKTAVARVRIYEKGVGFTVNGKDYHDYFRQEALAHILKEALEVMRIDGKAKIDAHVIGGGSHAQAEAVRHGIARALVKQDPDSRKQLRSKNLLTRDPRMKERRKFGLKKARRAPQWSKR